MLIYTAYHHRQHLSGAHDRILSCFIYLTSVYARARACVRNRSEDYYKNIVFVLRAFEAARRRTGRDETIIQQQNRGCSRAHESRPPTFITMVIFYRNGFYSYFVSRICLYRPRYTLPII